MSDQPSACESLSDDDADVADLVMWKIDDNPRRDYSPSEIARAVKITTEEARRVLPALVADGHILAHGNGAWTRYTARHRPLYLVPKEF